MQTQASERKIDIALIRAGDKPGNLKATLDIPDSLDVPENFKPTPGLGCFRFMTPKDGDKRVVWDSRDFAQISDAKIMFDQAVLQGLVPYRVGVNGRASSDVMAEFDPYAEEIIFLPVSMVAAG